MMKLRYRPVLAILLPFVITAFAPVPSIPKKLDLIGMIRHIHSNNDSLNTVNSSIVGNLSDINQLAGTTAKINTNLHSIKDGLQGERSSLNKLNTYSQQEIQLSKSLNQLAFQLSSNLQVVNQNSLGQNQSITQLISTTNSLSQLAAQIEKTNGTITNKLNSASQVTKQIANTMP